MLFFFFLTRDGEKIGGRRHLVAMHEQKGAAAVFLGLLIKVPAVSTSCNRKFPAPSALLHRQFLWFAQRQSTIEEQNQKGEDLGGVWKSSPGTLPPPRTRLMPPLPAQALAAGSASGLLVMDNSKGLGAGD